MGTRARVPSQSITSSGGVIAATTPASFPSIFAWNRSLFSVFSAIASSKAPGLVNSTPVENTRQQR
jgi:hypothetical protein